MALYRHDQVKDNCGFGLIAHMDGDVSHKLVRTSIHALDRMQHRGGIASDGKTGDGCGLLMQKPDNFFRTIAQELGFKLGRKYAVGTVFLSQDSQKAQIARALIEKELQQETLTVLGWRQVPVNPDVLGPIARDSLPQIEQVFVNAPPGWRKKDLERRLYMARRRIENTQLNDDDFYIASLSNLVTIYKGLVMPKDLAAFYPDLADLRLQTAICVFHQRFSTNTQPKWPLAQPFRFLAHNGEINTIGGNRQWAQARSYKFSSPLLPDLAQAKPYVNLKGSDSSSLDNMLEMLLAGGMDLFRAMRLLVPPAWVDNPCMDEQLRAFYEFNSMHMEPWDGPAGIVMTNGRHVACNLDRNGLRPARYVITKDRLITLASESGIWDYAPDEVVEKGRVGPGQMLAIDTYTGKVWNSAQIDDDLKDRHPYKEWLDDNIRRLIPFEHCDGSLIGQRLFCDNTMSVYHKLFNFSREEIEQVIKVMAENGQEAVGSMGDDTPMAVLSRQVRNSYDFFRQKFAQVTNPPIDPLREKHVMSLATCIGREQNVFNETCGHADRVLFDSPILMYTDIKQLKAFNQAHYACDTLDLNYCAEKDNLQNALQQLGEKAVDSVRDKNTVILILSDRYLEQGKLVIPAPLAVGRVQQALVEAELRCDTNILVETASARDPHHCAVLLGLGATAIYPFLAYETVEQLCEQNSIQLGVRQAVLNYKQALNKGLLKIMSKMGISTIASYRCSQLFEVIGLDQKVLDLCCVGMESRVEGAGFSDLQQDQHQLMEYAWNPMSQLGHGGLLKFVYRGEYHCYNPDVVQTLQQAVNSGDYQDYLSYADLVNHRPVAHFRDLLKLNKENSPVSLDQVEPAQSLFSRFDSAAMSIGALSPEAHEALAVAMNQIGGKSNSGEGGEDPRRFATLKNSKIKQIASGRFGVTAHYLMNAEVIQIKVAQGAKPGEGGQLPGHKVTNQIATLRYSVPGVTLISPPPHHDIYSIEDLAQLIFDLKQINPKALVSVKLVSEPGVGTIATGVAKAYADLITISGYDGGTGASPLTSVKYAGSPWELGLAETHQALVANGLRHKIRLQVDGGLKTGLDVVKAAILGAESFGFGTGPMVALGCKFLRICHLNNCATGVATQDETLRQKYFRGLPEKVVNYFSFIAEETRQIMASLGVTRFEELIGKTELLTRAQSNIKRQQQIDLSRLLHKFDSPHPLHCASHNPSHDEGELNQILLNQCQEAIERKSGGVFHYPIRNTDRSVGAGLSGLIAQHHGNQAMASHPLTLHFDGTAGQSFGVWNTGGLNLLLTGDANDYVGKGMTGGKLVIKPHPGVSFATHQASIMGNTCLYGATGGRLFAAGCAGERFAVRNSGALAVIEGLGDNGCEYMTAGTIVNLGTSGLNLGAGMTGGFAYIIDEHRDLDAKINKELVEALPLSEYQVHQEHLRSLISQHQDETHSPRASQILSDFDRFVDMFKIVKPKASDVHALLGHKSRSAAELRVQAQ